MHAAGPRPRPRPAPGARTQVTLGRALPVLVMAVVVVADLVTPDSERLDRLLITVPALAAATWSVRGTIGLGLVAMALRALLVVARDEFAADELLASEGLILGITAAAAWVSAVRTRYERDLAEVTAVADVVQRVVLRPPPPRIGPVELHLLYVAAAAKARIGGDFYEAVRIPGAVRIMLGDVQGKGLGAVETASVLLGAFRSTAYDAPDLPALADRLDEGLARYAAWDPESDAAERFATVVLVELPDGGGTARLLNCGHPAPLLQHGDEVTSVDVADPSLPLNLAGLADSRHRVEEFPFGPGDRLLLYTDGVSETRDRAGVFYPLEERARQWAAAPSGQVPELLHRDLAAYVDGGLDDDVAALLVVRTGGQGAPDEPR
ncbi:serine/threonine-protein phosphatase [Streptomyces sp. R302]|uniref:PP2C family protein-serine/threonine phosphatase n=1 Tax=unclassified Streptomyces TaxID=2593676 RepID=UPI00145C97E7|nr:MULTISPECIES: PP2C family protein-serine/threonine phosphatase [unclassified Streptomyces]NML51906.1 serine/threonine-protein phosphatase [Streptomyces sp. R301]NML81526.1 serine/threonine-protein phosphatase [Streptomyces sp. R302]